MSWTSRIFIRIVPPQGSPLLNTAKTFPTAYQISPNLRASYVMQTAVSVERQITKNANIAVSYLNSRGLASVPDAQHQRSAARNLRPEQSGERRKTVWRCRRKHLSVRVGRHDGAEPAHRERQCESRVEGVAVRLVHA